MQPAVVNGSVHTGCKELPANLSVRVDWAESVLLLCTQMCCLQSCSRNSPRTEVMLQANSVTRASDDGFQWWMSVSRFATCVWNNVSRLKHFKPKGPSSTDHRPRIPDRCNVFLHNTIEPKINLSSASWIDLDAVLDFMSCLSVFSRMKHMITTGRNLYGRNWSE